MSQVFTQTIPHEPVVRKDGEGLAPPSAESTRLVGNNADFAVATLGSYVLLVWKKRIDALGVIWANKAFADLLLERPNDKISFLTVVQADCELSTPPVVRKELSELLGKYKDSLVAGAIAFEGEGFRMTLVRSIITAINIASRTRFPNAVFSDTATALDWLHEHSTNPNSSIRVHQLMTALDRIRRF